MKNHPNAFVLAGTMLFLGFMVPSCLSSTQKPSDMLQNSLLFQDLHSDHHDALYRSQFFLSNHGGPSLSSNDKPSLIRTRSIAVSWLEQAEDLPDLIESYSSYVITWNPVFQDN